jgi:hypothetical protein
MVVLRSLVEVHWEGRCPVSSRYNNYECRRCLLIIERPRPSGPLLRSTGKGGVPFPDTIIMNVVVAYR